ncbi:YkvI family membrane protein [Corynebacterium sphenisci]|uniref:YkvI family membrane protein n=1 Tax=Corynebacterium sphenisci TaxID=191493 RepID=UPI0026E09BC0|nr:hypothetical protein [Corynebacterium sphenisci]MDO5731330.1 hypothetical protein [Corynebacterium sphenisci]
MLKRAIGISMSFIGLVVGAGFASGQEMMQYFVAFGLPGIWGAALAGAIMVVAGYATLQVASYLQAEEHMAVFSRISRGPWTSRILDLSVMATLFITGFVMLAGAGSNLNQQFGLPLIVGSLIMLALILGAGMLDVHVVNRVIGAITPFIIVLLVFAGAWALLHNGHTFAELHDQSTMIRAGFPGWMRAILPHWLVASLNYVGMNLMVGVSMAIVIGGTNLSPREAGIGGLLGGVGYGVLVLLVSSALYLNSPELMAADLPTMELVTAINPVLGVVMSLVVFGMIFNTGIGMFYALGKRLAAGRQDRFRVVFSSVVLAGFAISFVGFKQLIAVLYPLIGYFGILLVIVVIVGWLRGRATIREESARREHIRALAVRRLDPRMRFTKGDARRLRKAVDDSNVDDRALVDAVYGEVVTELIADDEVDFPDPAVDSAPSYAHAAAAAADAATIVYPEDEDWEDRPDDADDHDGPPAEPGWRFTLKTEAELAAEAAAGPAERARRRRADGRRAAAGRATARRRGATGPSRGHQPVKARLLREAADDDGPGCGRT